MLWVVAGSGPSLDCEVAEQCRGHRCIAVNDAYLLLPFADSLYAADDEWWILHDGCRFFRGEKWTTISKNYNNRAIKQFGLRFVPSRRLVEGFSFEPGIIHQGGNSGFQAVNLALLWGATRIVLVGFDMQGSHFFGEHPQMPRRSPAKRNFARWIRHFERAAKLLPDGIKIINATPDSAMKCFPMMDLAEALNAQEG